MFGLGEVIRMRERTRSTSLALRPTEQEALERLAKSAGLSRSGLVRRWIAEATGDDELGKITPELEREAELPVKAGQDGEVCGEASQQRIVQRERTRE